MRKYSLLYTAFVSMIILGILNVIALEFYFYWTIWWYDLMMHALAGLSGALFALWFWKSLGVTRVILLAFATLMIVGIVWEVFEYVLDLVPSIGYWQDTVTDLLADGLGAVLACFYATKQFPKSS